MNPVKGRLEEGRSRDILFLDDGDQRTTDVEEEGEVSSVALFSF
jgi:hypothetical protein